MSGGTAAELDTYKQTHKHPAIIGLLYQYTSGEDSLPHIYSFTKALCGMQFGINILLFSFSGSKAVLGIMFYCI